MPPHENAGVGRFPEGGLLDRVDKCISRPLQKLSLPTPLEFGLTLPGVWFGCPVYSVCVVPLLLAAPVPDQERGFLLGAVLPTATAGFTWWCKLCRDSLVTGKGIVRAYSILMSKSLLLCLPHAGMGISKWLGSQSGTRAMSNYLSAWFCTQLTVEALKGVVWRLRPTAVDAEELAPVRRAFREIGIITNIPSQANLSFPSGDAAGGACFAMALRAVTPQLWGPAFAAAALCGAGRVYFHCHHVLDVVAGQCIGGGIAWMLSQHTPCNWPQVLLSQLFLMLLWKPVQKLKPKQGVQQELNSRAFRSEGN
mmetsp:Transcript_127347/g.254397  ORF Transcript_127347/g.254397 Transcript_127347/m.254397 type:complete len:309 (-) Transcript_127347:232-1158(-)